jgi:KaiC/GvpD/RAD55 family RecA-like ATPase
LTVSISSVFVLVAAGIYFAFDSTTTSDMDGMMNGDPTNSNSWIISIILIGAAISIVIGIILYLFYPKKEKADEPNRTSYNQSANLQRIAEPDKLDEIKTQKIKGRLATGNTKLDKLLYGGIPPKFAVVLTTPSSDEGNALIKSFIETGAKNNEITFYVTIDPSFARDLARKFPSNFYLFIANPQTDIRTKKTPNVYALKGIENLTEINIALTKVFRKLDITYEGPRRICLNIISDVLLQHGSIITRKWLSELIATLNSEEFTILAVLNPQMHSSEEVHALLGLFEGEINIRERETVKELKRFLKIKRMSSKKYLKNEILLTDD